MIIPEAVVTAIVAWEDGSSEFDDTEKVYTYHSYMQFLQFHIYNYDLPTGSKMVVGMCGKGTAIKKINDWPWPVCCQLTKSRMQQYEYQILYDHHSWI